MMQIKILSPLWGHEHLKLKMFLDKIKAANYDGIDTWIPQDKAEKQTLFDFLQQNEMHIVSHQHSAEGSTFKKFRQSFIEQLHICAEPGPLLINSHTGRDYFTLQQNLALIDAARDFSEKTGIIVAHETHRGRFGYAPQMISRAFKKNRDFCITADFSHWVCVTESMLENFQDILAEAITRSRHIHARIGFEEGPQVADPRAPEYQYALEKFLGWWDRIITGNRASGHTIMPVTTEFGPYPYMPANPYTKVPVADQFEINCFMKDLLRARYNNSPKE
ncbi:apurinic/apyrimidinic endonuclease family protein [Mucilaginibacter segetis]|uniref:Sugar phosphate isomerase/epimerase n=1 Tax=Mucilaginibacter segetis TaxID=2793071 RepID=A0A934UM26_9SPHI|nr:sugar phosphate isomerase/epimerase [Mucilaginibacter segetis]MBK0378442.1 sugar phosphate isomerase/epimerase [Mucilaginibacter segetis]